MKIVLDHQIFAFQRYGGISRYYTRVAERLLRRPGYQLRVVAPLHVNAYLAGMPAGSVVGQKVPDGDLVRRVARNVGHLVGPTLIAAEKPDLVHETYFSSRSSAPAGVPTVVTVHDMIHELFQASYSPNDRTSSLKRQAVMRADHVICVSQSTENDLLKLIPEAAGKTSVVLHGFDNFRGSGAIVGHDDAVGRGHPRPFLLYVGERARYKNFDGLLKAYAANRQISHNFDLVCFGGGKPGQWEEDLVADQGLDRANIHFMGGDDSRLAHYFVGASAFVYPSRYEGFGIPPLEAMSAGCPVIASNQSSIPEVCGDAAQYFDPDDIDWMGTAIEKVLNSAELRSDLITRGYLRLREFSWDRCAEATSVVYEQLV